MSRHPATKAAENRVLLLIASGRARSRRELAEALNLSPSTISQHVRELIGRQLVAEGPVGESNGGRPARELRLAGGTGCIGAIDLGGGHARLGILRRGGGIIQTSEHQVDLREGVDSVLTRISRELSALFDSLALDGSLEGVGMALPGPVNVNRRTVESPSRMPGWTDRDLGAPLEQALKVPVVVENDANAMALGEHFARSASERHSITVKSGTAIGSGVIVAGQVYRGAGGAAGDITHTRVAAAAENPCSCGNLGCLETVASGAGLVRLLRDQGYDVSRTSDVITLVRSADPTATTLARAAGSHLGEELCAIVNFFNPAAIYLGGSLSTLEPYVSAIRSQLYAGAHPLMTRDLKIELSKLGPDANLVGVARLVEEALVHQSVGGAYSGACEPVS